MSDKATTLMARDESKGRPYPMYVERLFFIGAIVAFFVLQPVVMDAGDVPSWVSLFAGWCLLPACLMFLTELLGRVLQRVLAN